jgi:hypothetical protein
MNNPYTVKDTQASTTSEILVTSTQWYKHLTVSLNINNNTIIKESNTLILVKDYQLSVSTVRLVKYSGDSTQENTHKNSPGTEQSIILTLKNNTNRE